jgi:predicted nucleic acid-binding protein
MATLVDSNVLLDVMTEDPVWAAWSSDALAAAADRSVLVINPLTYAEVSTRFTRIEDLDEALSPLDFRREQLPWPAAFLAAKAFVAYRSRGGRRSSTLPDFYIGAHAAVAGHTLLTRDAARYRTYFPTLAVSAPP